MSPRNQTHTMTSEDVEAMLQRNTDALEHVEPSHSFVSDLKQRLSEAHAVAILEQERHARKLRARIGTGIGALIVIALVVRLIGSIIMVITFLAKNRRRNAVV